MIFPVIPPAVAHGHAGLPVAAGIPLSRNSFLRGGEIPLAEIQRLGISRGVKSAESIQTVVEKHPGIRIPAGLHKFLRLPGFALCRALRIIPPHDIDRAVVTHQMPHLGMQVILIGRLITGNLLLLQHAFLPGGIAQIRADGVIIILLVPVNHTVVKPHAHTGSAGRIRKLLHDIAVQQRPAAIFRIRRIEQGKTLVVLRCQHHVTAASLPGQCRPCLGAPGLRPEQWQSLRRVGIRIQPKIALNPLTATRNPFELTRQTGVQAVVDKHAELGISPPLHASIAFLLAFRGRYGRKHQRTAQQGINSSS